MPDCEALSSGTELVPAMLLFFGSAPEWPDAGGSATLEVGWLLNVATGNIHETSSLRHEISRKCPVILLDFAVPNFVDHLNWKSMIFKNPATVVL
jgi:hypothetical protein